MTFTPEQRAKSAATRAAQAAARRTALAYATLSEAEIRARAEQLDMAKELSIATQTSNPPSPDPRPALANPAASAAAPLPESLAPPLPKRSHHAKAAKPRWPAPPADDPFYRPVRRRGDPRPAVHLSPIISLDSSAKGRNHLDFDYATAPIDEAIDRATRLKAEADRAWATIQKRQAVSPDRRWTCWTQSHLDLVPATLRYQGQPVRSQCLRSGDGVTQLPKFTDNGHFRLVNDQKLVDPIYCCNFLCYQIYMQHKATPAPGPRTERTPSTVIA